MYGFHLRPRGYSGSPSHLYIVFCNTYMYAMQLHTIVRLIELKVLSAQLLESGAESELIAALSREKNAATELLIDLLHCPGTTGLLKEQLSQQDILDMLQLLQSPLDSAGMLRALATHWDSTAR